MIYLEANKWSQRIKDLSGLIDQSNEAERVAPNIVLSATRLFFDVMKGIVQKPVSTGITVPVPNGYFYGETTYWLYPKGIGFRCAHDARTSRVERLGHIKKAVNNDELLEFVKSNCDSSYVDKLLAFRRFLKKTDGREERPVFDLPKITISTVLTVRGEMIREEVAFTYDTVSFSHGRVSIEPFLKGQRVDNITVLPFIQPVYPQVKTAAKKYNTILRNHNKRYAKALRVLKDDLSSWLVLGEL